MRALSRTVLFLPLALCAAPVPLIFDTDIGNDIDDALALAVIHALETRQEAKLLAVTITKDNRWSAPFVDLVNHFYGRPGIPIGVVKNGKTPEDAAYTKLPCQRQEGGRRLYPRSIESGEQAEEASALIRRVLERQPDAGVVIVQVGFSTNLARLLSQSGARDLVQRKVKLLSVMAGQFPAGKPEYNVRVDLEAARKVFTEWPSEIVFSGFEVGLSIPYPARSIKEDFRWTAHHPIVDAYRAYKKMPYDRPSWDLTSVLYAVRPHHGYFSLSERGWVRLDQSGVTRLEPDPSGKHRYLKVNEAQRAKVLEALVQLASLPACRR